MADLLKQALALGLLRNVDYYFARHMQAIDNREDEHLGLLAALTSASVGAGHVCLDLEAIAGKPLRALETDTDELPLPPLQELLAALDQSAIVAAAGEQAPLILEQGKRLYLGRYWWFEQRVAEALLERQAPLPASRLDMSLLQDSVARMFPPQDDQTDWQMLAAVMAVLQRFVVISGGPGTGKTHTVTSILALLIEQSAGQRLNIALAAPTGKAAARLSESIRNAKPSIDCAQAIKDLIPEEASTIHRLIGIRPGTVEPRHHAANPLGVDLLVVDEASMIDLPLMARLLLALPAQARIILLGDKDQLSSVEAGSVFADISGDGAAASFSEPFVERLGQSSGRPVQLMPAGPGSGLTDCVVQLQKSYRFDSESGIGALAAAINQGDSQMSMQLLQGNGSGVSYLSAREIALDAYLESQLIPAYADCLASSSAQQAFDRFNKLRVLCALRKTASGVEAINGLIENRLRRKGLIRSEGIHYKGRPVLITRNDYGLGLFNGDMGVLWPDPDAGGQLRAWFILPDNSIRRVLPARLPQHETAYAMTVHKSQGSEFDRVLMILPNEYSELLTRELIYTGITRARQTVELWGDPDVIRQTIDARVKRVTGLAQKLYS